jgi:hypothetical protein
MRHGYLAFMVIGDHGLDHRKLPREDQAGIDSIDSRKLPRDGQSDRQTSSFSIDSVSLSSPSGSTPVSL